MLMCLIVFFLILFVFTFQCKFLLRKCLWCLQLVFVERQKMGAEWDEPLAKWQDNWDASQKSQHHLIPDIKLWVNAMEKSTKKAGEKLDKQEKNL